jgi:methylmalonyl-CoA mutase
LPNAFARRIARNTQSILIAESHLWRVSDPAHGAGTIENLTHALSERAWEDFQRIESEGGIVASLESGALQTRITAARDARLAEVKEGKRTIIGITAYKPSQEIAAAIEDLASAYPTLEGLAPERLARSFET